MDQSASYRITVRGTLPAGWSDRLGGMRVTTEVRPGERPVTTLVGELHGQAALSGVLDTLYQLHLPIVSVSLLDDDGGNQKE